MPRALYSNDVLADRNLGWRVRRVSNLTIDYWSCLHLSWIYIEHRLCGCDFSPSQVARVVMCISNNPSVRFAVQVHILTVNFELEVRFRVSGDGRNLRRHYESERSLLAHHGDNAVIDHVWRWGFRWAGIRSAPALHRLPARINAQSGERRVKPALGPGPASTINRLGHC
jgi:hypothetical protein